MVRSSQFSCTMTVMFNAIVAAVLLIVRIVLCRELQGADMKTDLSPNARLLNEQIIAIK